MASNDNSAAFGVAWTRDEDTGTWTPIELEGSDIHSGPTGVLQTENGTVLLGSSHRSAASTSPTVLARSPGSTEWASGVPDLGAFPFVDWSDRSSSGNFRAADVIQGDVVLVGSVNKLSGNAAPLVAILDERFTAATLPGWTEERDGFLTGVVALVERVVVVGVEFGSEGLRPISWQMEEDQTWSELTIDSGGTEIETMSALARSGNRVIASGYSASVAAVWELEGAHWRLVQATGLPLDSAATVVGGQAGFYAIAIEPTQPRSVLYSQTGEVWSTWHASEAVDYPVALATEQGSLVVLGSADLELQRQVDATELGLIERLPER